ncbi:MAG: family 16 glycoside hydrolase, partial [Anaerolineales bacterium]
MDTVRCLLIFSLLVSFFTPALPAAAAFEAPVLSEPETTFPSEPSSASAELLPAWMARPAAEPASAELLPAWFASHPPKISDPAPVGVGLNAVTAGALRVSGPASANVCDTVTYTVVFTNSATPATSVMVTSTMPTPYSPSPQDCGPFDMEAGEVQSCTFTFAGGCAAVSGQNVVTLTQDGVADPIVRYTDLVVNPGAITVRKEPAVTTAYIEDVVTWTVYVENTGYGDVINVDIDDVLGSGFSHVSGLTSTFVPAMSVGEVLTFPVSARVVGCSDLNNVVTATWGCGGGSCLDPQTATAAVDLQMRNPDLEYTLPTFDVPFCAGQQSFTVPVTNVGDGTAYSTTLTTDLNTFDVTTAPGVTYSGGVFHLPPIPPGSSYDLIFTLTLPSDVCSTPQGGSFNFDIVYYDLCNNPYYELPQNRPWQMVDVPGDVGLTKTMPAEVYRGQTVTATIDVDLTGISGTVQITDTVPDGWTVVDADGGSVFTVSPTTYITWAVGLSTTFSVVLLTPDDSPTGCTACGTEMTNLVAAWGADCQDCVRTASASASTYIQCDDGVSSAKAVSAPLVPCSDETYTYTNTYTFGSAFVVTPTWGGLVFTETLPYQTYVTGTAAVWVSDGLSSCAATFSETIVGGELVITNIAPSCAVDLPGATLEITYQTRVGEPEACTDASWYDWSYLDLGVTGNAACAYGGVLQEGVFVETRAPEMRLSLEGLPPSISECGEYTVTLTAERTTPDVAAYDTVVDLVTDTYAVLTVLGFGGVTPVLTETDAGGYHWYYGDAFTSALTATVDLRVKLRCTSAAPFEASLHYDNRCADDDVYRERCTDGGTLGNPLTAPCAPILTKFPEVIYATNDIVRWSLTVYNAGAGPAYDVTLTDTLGSGLRYVSSTLASTQGSVAGVVPVTSAHHVTWTLPVIQPKERVTLGYYAEIISCDDLTNVFGGTQGCLGEACQKGCAAVSHVELPPTVLLNTNQFISPIDTCYTRTVTATVRNAGLLSVYSATVTETLPVGLNYVPGTTEVSTDTVNWQPGPDPTIVGRQISWGPGNGAPLDVWMARIRPNETVYVRFQTTASCPFTGGQVRVQTAYVDPCGVPHVTQASSYLMQSHIPQLTFEKVGQHLTRTHPTQDLVYAEPGETVVWTITVQNATGASPATNVVVTDTLPPNAGYLSATPGYSLTTPAVGSSGLISWDLDIVYPGQTVVLTVTSVISDPEGCEAVDTSNEAVLTWGCGDGCRFHLEDDAYLRTRPLLDSPGLVSDLGGTTLNRCGGVLTVTLVNDGPPAYDVVLTDTLPAGFVYSDTLSASTPPDIIVDGGSYVRYAWGVLPSGETTLAFRVRNANGSGDTCTLPTGDNLIEVRYDDDAVDCLTTGPYTVTGTQAIAVVGPTLQITKSPPDQTVDVGDPITWTLTVDNAGSGTAYNVVVTDVVGSNYVNVAAGNGSDGAVPIVAGNAITWLPDPIPGGGTWSAQVTAVLTDTGTNVNRAWVRGGCDTGCVTSSDQDDAHTTLLQEFGKTPELQTGTIGSLVVFHLAASLSDWDALYEDLTLTDALPPELGYVSAVLTYTYDNDGSHGGPLGPVVVGPDSAPPLAGTGNVIWYLGDLSGTIQINGVITAVIRDVPSGYDGARLTNNFRMTYTDDGVPYVYTDTADVDVLEPLLHLGKSYVTPSGCAATLLEDNFNTPNTSISPFGNWARLNSNAGIQDGMLHLSGSGDVESGAVLSDFSMSWMARKNTGNIDSAEVWTIFRINGDWNQNSYVFEWRNSEYRLRRYVGGALSTLATFSDVPGREEWVHFEIRAEGDRIRIYADGQLIFDLIDAAHTSGSTQIRTTNTSDVDLDDILVTRLNQTGCTVGAGDLVTYTLTVSNQARLPGYDLVITDVIPAGTSLWSYTFTSSDPTAAVGAEPAPIPGATGALVWQVNHLTPTLPFDPLNHTYLNLEVVLKVSEQITANTVLANQAFLAYDGQLGTGPLGIERDYSGGSHSTAIRTISGGIAKTTQFSPPPTATLGTVVTYTLIVPTTPISATLYDVVVTDTLDSRLYIEDVTTGGGTGAASDWDAQTVTATFASIPHATQAFVTVTAIISDPLGALAGDLITNVATLTHATDPLTTSNEVSTTVGEPDLTLVKASDPPTSSTVGAGDLITYAVSITNVGAPAGPAPAYDIVFTDTLPGYANDAAPTLLEVSLDGAPVAGSLYTTSYTGGVLSLVFTPTFAFSVPVGSVLLIRYAATVDADVGAGLDLINLAEVSWSSLPGATPGDRNYGPVQDGTNLHTEQPSIVKAVLPPTATIGSLITYTIRVPEPSIAATLYNVTVTDQLSPWLWLDTVDAPGGGLTSTADAFTVTYPTIPAGTQRLITVTAVVVSSDWQPPWEPVAGDLLTNVVTLSHDTGITTSTEVTVTIVEPELVIVKASEPPQSSTVAAGQAVTYTVTVTNTGDSAAYRYSVEDQLPVGMWQITPTILSITIDGSPVPPGDYVSGYFDFAGIVYAYFENWAPLPAGSVLEIVYVAYVDPDVTAGVDLTNTASVDWMSLSPDLSPEVRHYPPISTTNTVHAGYPLLELTKSASPSPVEAGEPLTYTLDLVNTGVVSATGVVVTDAIPVNTTFVTATLPHVGPVPDNSAGSVISWTVGTLAVGASRTFTLVVQTQAPLLDGTLITNTAWVTSSEGLTDTDTVTTPVQSSHLLTITKSGTPSPVGAGALLTYTLDWAVGGNEPALGVTLSDAVPANTTYWTSIPAATTAPPVGGTGLVRWDLGDRNPPEAGSVTLVVLVDSPLLTGTQIFNAALITDTQGLTDTDTLTTPVESWHSLALTKTAQPSPVEAGALLTYTLDWAVDGNEPALGVTLSDAVPANTTYWTSIPAATTAPPVGGTGLVRWDLGDRNPPEAGSVTLVVLVDSPLLTGTQIFNAALITDTQGLTDTDTLTTPVESWHSLALTKTAQ